MVIQVFGSIWQARRAVDRVSLEWAFHVLSVRRWL